MKVSCGIAGLLALTGCGESADTGGATDWNEASTPTPITRRPETQPRASLEERAEEVRRLNVACERAGGGVSGSPDCKRAVEAEAALNADGWCLDYTDNEALKQCARSED